jgi:hypothetical protein
VAVLATLSPVRGWAQRSVAAAPTAEDSTWDQANAPILPDAEKTPGATLAVTAEDICAPGYAHKVRDVPAEVKREVYVSYGVDTHDPGEYEVDHLISLELGGSNSVRNLWPESYITSPWNAHVKDALENRLHRAVCDGVLDLATAQHDIAKDWIAAYKRYFHRDLPPPPRAH